jgi:hypothetical protein
MRQEDHEDKEENKKGRSLHILKDYRNICLERTKENVRLKALMATELGKFFTANGPCQL